MVQMLNERRDQMVALCRAVGAKRLDAFGSAVREDFDPARSDIDFIVELDAATPEDYAESYFTLKEGLEDLFGRPVDLVTERSLTNPYFRDRVARQRQTVYAR